MIAGHQRGSAALPIVDWLRLLPGMAATCTLYLGPNDALSYVSMGALAVGACVALRRSGGAPIATLSLVTFATLSSWALYGHRVWWGVQIGVAGFVVASAAPRSWYPRRRADFVWAAGVGGAASLALWAWVVIESPVLPSLGSASGFGAVAALVGFGLLNALAEEWLYRWPIIEASGSHRPLVLVSSSVLFGLAHRTGVPSGGWGMAMAAVFGFAQGLLVLRRKSLGAAIASHVVVDVVVGLLVIGRLRA